VSRLLRALDHLAWAIRILASTGTATYLLAMVVMTAPHAHIAQNWSPR
jgi:hypothetical protein